MKNANSATHCHRSQARRECMHLWRLQNHHQPCVRGRSVSATKTEDLFVTLARGQKFTKLDLLHAYQQVLPSEDTQQCVTINTHKGLYRYNRLSFSIASAPAIFQYTMEKLFHRISRITVYIDDILVTGKTCTTSIWFSSNCMNMVCNSNVPSVPSCNHL